MGQSVNREQWLKFIDELHALSKPGEKYNVEEMNEAMRKACEMYGRDFEEWKFRESID